MFYEFCKKIDDELDNTLRKDLPAAIKRADKRWETWIDQFSVVIHFKTLPTEEMIKTIKKASLDLEMLIFDDYRPMLSRKNKQLRYASPQIEQQSTKIARDTLIYEGRTYDEDLIHLDRKEAKRRRLAEEVSSDTD